MWLRKGDTGALVFVADCYTDTIKRCLSEGWLEALAPLTPGAPAGASSQSLAPIPEQPPIITSTVKRASRKAGK